MSGVIEFATPLLLATLGGLISQRAGVLNVTLEGLIQAGAFTAALVFLYTENSFLATLSAIIVGLIFCSLLIFGHLGLKTNLFISGLAINLLIPALADLILPLFLGTQGVIRLSLNAKHHSLSLQFFAIALGLTRALAFFLHRTSLGLRLKAARTSQELLKDRGLDACGYKALAFILSGGLGALAGATLTFGLEVYVFGMSAGKGWLALAAVYLGFCRFSGVLIVCLALAIIEQVSHLLQGFSLLPSGFILAICPLITCLIFITFNALKKFDHRSSVF